MNRRERRWAVLVTLVLVVASSPPYFIAGKAMPKHARFSGLIFGPQGGKPYIARMCQGLIGFCLFHLVPASERSRGVYPFHLACFQGISRAGSACRWPWLATQPRCWTVQRLSCAPRRQSDDHDPARLR